MGGLSPPILLRALSSQSLSSGVQSHDPLHDQISKSPHSADLPIIHLESQGPGWQVKGGGVAQQSATSTSWWTGWESPEDSQSQSPHSSIRSCYVTPRIFFHSNLESEHGGCELRASWQAYRCKGLQHHMLVIESLDGDTETRRLSPMALHGGNTGSGAEYTDLINGPMDHGKYIHCCIHWMTDHCGGITV